MHVIGEVYHLHLAEFICNGQNCQLVFEGFAVKQCICQSAIDKVLGQAELEIVYCVVELGGGDIPAGRNFLGHSIPH